MQRALGKFLPIVILAIWAQVLAPVVPYLVAAADPFHSEICSGHSESDQGGQPVQDHIHDCCSVFCFAHAASGQALLDDVAVGALKPMQDVRRVVWPDDAALLLLHRLRVDHQARAPPHA
ncbi:MAG TPA: DUF2946 family protein [Xanthobacteraceae bacterium]|jgi:hypothetical protein|nr:DUF2946 family protein [Xanthobacteraceae bacterium]